LRESRRGRTTDRRKIRSARGARASQALPALTRFGPLR
jgi:hypothetical protein